MLSCRERPFYPFDTEGWEHDFQSLASLTVSCASAGQDSTGHRLSGCAPPTAPQHVPAIIALLHPQHIVCLVIGRLMEG